MSPTFLEELPEREARKRLKTALYPRGNWIRSVLIEADRTLTEIREGFRGDKHPDAGGLIIASTKEEARAIKGVLESLTGEEASIVLSDEVDDEGRDPLEQIEEFDTGEHRNRRWIIAVRIISEGVDIPRLRVGVYAVAVISELFFRQFVGRFTRWIHGMENQRSYVLIPADPVLVSYAQRIIEERDHDIAEALRDKLEELKQKAEELQLTFDDLFPDQPFVTGYSSTATPHDFIFAGQRYETVLRQQAADFMREHPELAGRYSEEDAMVFLQALGMAGQSNGGATATNSEADLRGQLDALGNDLEGMVADVSKRLDWAKWVTNTLLKRIAGPKGKRTPQQFETCFTVLGDLLTGDESILAPYFEQVADLLAKPDSRWGSQWKR